MPASSRSNCPRCSTRPSWSVVAMFASICLRVQETDIVARTGHFSTLHNPDVHPRAAVHLTLRRRGGGGPLRRDARRPERRERLTLRPRASRRSSAPRCSPTHSHRVAWVRWRHGVWAHSVGPRNHARKPALDPSVQGWRDSRGGNGISRSVVSSGERHAAKTPAPAPYNVSSLASFPAHWSRVRRNLSNEVRPESGVAVARRSLERDAFRNLNWTSSTRERFNRASADTTAAARAGDSPLPVQPRLRGPDPIPSSEWRVKPGSGPESLLGRSRPRRLHGSDRARRARPPVRISSGNFLIRRESHHRCGRVVEGAEALEIARRSGKMSAWPESSSGAKR